MYGILSKGLHELSEQECLEAFPVMRVGIELILDEKIEAAEREKKVSGVSKAISALRGRLGKPTPEPNGEEEAG